MSSSPYKMDRDKMASQGLFYMVPLYGWLEAQTLARDEALRDADKTFAVLMRFPGLPDTVVAEMEKERANIRVALANAQPKGTASPVAAQDDSRESK